jgi:hypothetical protein
VAVGQSGDGAVPPQTLVEAWNGSVWSVVPSPNHGTSGSYLWDVSCTSASACMAVGTDNGAATLAERWDGSSWTVVKPLDPSTPFGLSELNGVSCISAQTCTAVGAYDDINLGDLPLVESWDGSTWTLVPNSTPAGGGPELYSVACPAAGTCLGVGMFWMQTPIQALAGTSTGSWSLGKVTTPGNGDSNLSSVTCTSPSSCVAVGNYDNTTTGLTLVESWNGLAWSTVPTPNPTTTAGIASGLNGVECTAPGSCIAVGQSGSAPNPGTQNVLIEASHQGSWSVVPSPTEGSGGGLMSVACSPSGTCTAVGYYIASSGIQHPLIESTR